VLSTINEVVIIIIACIIIISGLLEYSCKLVLKDKQMT